MNSVKCPNCGLISWATEKNCRRCNQSLTMAPIYNAPPSQPIPAPQQGFQQPNHTQPAQQDYVAPLVPQQAQPDFTSQPQTNGFENSYSETQTQQFNQTQTKNFQSTYGAPKQTHESYQDYKQTYQQNHQANYQTNYQPNYQQQNHNYGHNAQYQQPYPPHFNQQPYGLAYRAQQKKGLATASMIIGIVSLVMCGLLGVGPIAGAILGIIGWNKAKKEPAKYGGGTMAAVGIGLNVLAFFVVFIAVARFMGSMPSNFTNSYRAANESSAISSMRILLDAEVTYQITSGQGQYGTLQQLGDGQLIDKQLASGSKNGYRFTILTWKNSCEITATPDTTTSGERSFYASCSDSVIRAARRNGLPANADDPPLDSTQPSAPNNYYDEDDY